MIAHLEEYDDFSLRFLNPDHMVRYYKTFLDLEGHEGARAKVKFFLLSAYEPVYNHRWDILDIQRPHEVIPSCWEAAWVDPISRLMIALVAILSGSEYASAAAEGTPAYAILYAQGWVQELNKTLPRHPLEYYEEPMD